MVMVFSFGLGFIGIGGSVLVMVYLGARMITVKPEDSKLLLESQVIEFELISGFQSHAFSA